MTEADSQPSHGRRKHHSHDADPDWTCNRCGWETHPVESFLDMFGDPGKPNDVHGPMPAIKDDEGAVFPLSGSDLSKVLLYGVTEQLAETVPRWADPDDDQYIKDVREYAKRSSKNRICTWCYKLYPLPNQRGYR